MRVVQITAYCMVYSGYLNIYANGYFVVGCNNQSNSNSSVGLFSVTDTVAIAKSAAANTAFISGYM